jgi:hypothetical protein
MSDLAESQAANVTPPRRGAVVAIIADATARSYDLTTLALGGLPWKLNQADWIYLTLQADGGRIYFHFRPDAGADLNDATIGAAGTPIAFTNAACAMVPDGGAFALRIQRNTDRYLVMKTSTGVATLRLHASSDPGL